MLATESATWRSRPRAVDARGFQDRRFVPRDAEQTLSFSWDQQNKERNHDYRMTLDSKRARPELSWLMEEKTDIAGRLKLLWLCELASTRGSKVDGIIVKFAHLA